ncbi:MAG: hypothetical protein KDJ29_07215 [Hyphomicrobiales bacterium]|nr:hypothetical protein [Hyphomicrobiales bacterium]
MRTVLDRLQTELATGRRADLQTSMGADLNPSYALRVELRLVETYRDNTTLASNALKTADLSFGAIRSDVTQIKDLLISAAAGNADSQMVRNAAETALQRLPQHLAGPGGVLNILSGEKTDTAPLTAYRQDPKSDAQLAFETAFQTATGAAYDESALSALDPADIDALFLQYAPDGVALTDWTTNWIAGEIRPRSILIDQGVTIEFPNVNTADGVRKAAAGMVLLAELASENLRPDTYARLMERALGEIGNGETALTGLSAQAGSLQQTLEENGIRLQARSAQFQNHIANLEAVDRYAVAAELNATQTNLEMAYTLTSRVQGLFLANFL